MDGYLILEQLADGNCIETGRVYLDGQSKTENWNSGLGVCETLQFCVLGGGPNR